MYVGLLPSAEAFVELPASLTLAASSLLLLFGLSYSVRLYA